jgi:dual specificity MAP kinase phosphatase
MNYTTEIIPDLWIGDKNSIDDITFLSENKIKCIINCTKDLDFNHSYSNAEHIKLNIDDQPNKHLFENNMEMYNKLEDVVKYIHRYLNKNESILVYCCAGKQRSATIIAAYIIKYGKVSAKQAIQYIKSKRPECFIPRVNFYMALQKFEKDFLSTI